VKTHTRNEALDLEVYALAALFILQNYLHRYRDLAEAAREAMKPLPAPAAPIPKGPRPPGWVGGWGEKW
jgi:phage terminase large subunit GpA-like protein